MYLFRAVAHIPTSIINNNNNYCIVTWSRENSTQESVTVVHKTPRLRNLKIWPVIKLKLFYLRYTYIKKMQWNSRLIHIYIYIYRPTLSFIFLLLNILIFALYNCNFYSCRIFRYSPSAYDSNSISRMVFVWSEMSKMFC